MIKWGKSEKETLTCSTMFLAEILTESAKYHTAADFHRT